MEIKKTKSKHKALHRTKKESWLEKDISIFPFKIKDSQRAYLYGQLNLLVRSGFDFNSSMEILIEEVKGKFQGILVEVQKEVINGKLLSESLRDNSHFSPYEFESLRVGEESGMIEDVLLELSKFYESRIALRRKFISVLTYPIIVLLVSFGVIYFMLSIVVPMFEDMFKRFDSELPSITKLIIRASDVFQVIAPFLILFVILALISNRLLKENKRLNYYKEKLLFGVPQLGAFFKQNLQSRFCQNMKLLTSAGTPLTRSLELTANMIGNQHFSLALKKCIKSIELGDQLHSSLKKTGLFNSRIISLIRVGEEVNKLDLMFEKCNEQLSSGLEHQSKQLSSLLEPLIIIVLGVIVGVILIAMYLPILNMSKIIN